MKSISRISNCTWLKDLKLCLKVGLTCLLADEKASGFRQTRHQAYNISQLYSLMTLDAIMSSLSGANVAGDASANKHKRPRAEANLIGDNTVTVEELAKRVDLLCKVASIHDRRLGICEAYMENVFFLPPTCALATQLTQSMSQWNKLKPTSGGHPMGHANLTVAAALIKYFCDNAISSSPGTPPIWTDHSAAIKEFAAKTNEIEDLKMHVAVGVGKLTKKGDKFLLKYSWKPSSFLHHSYETQFHILRQCGAEMSTGPAPRGPIMRELHGEQVGRNGGA